LKEARRPPSPSASVLDRSLPFVSETDAGTVFGTPDGFASDDDSDYFGDPVDIDMYRGSYDIFPPCNSPVLKVRRITADPASGSQASFLYAPAATLPVYST